MTGEQPVRLPKYKVPQLEENAFFKSVGKANKEFAEVDLALSGLDIEFMSVSCPPMLRLPEKALAGYVIPYHGLDGKLILDKESMMPAMFRTKLKHPPFSKDGKYTQPSTEQLQKYGLPGSIPYIHPLTLELENDTLICCEGEKKTGAVLKLLQLPAFGIGGCQMWRNPDGSGSIHPWIRALLDRKGINSITIIPDGDLLRYDICAAYGTFARALQEAGITVRILNPPDKIDDLLVAWGQEASARFADIKPVGIDDLVQSTASLVKKYGLAYKTDSKDRIVVHQHSSNVTRLMAEHPAFPRVWRDTDRNRVMVGDREAVPGHTEIEIANYFQHNLQFDRVNGRQILEAMGYMAHENSESPFLKWVKGQIWDGKQRLDTWLTDYWGVSSTPFTMEVASKWLISSCARMEKPGTKIDWMPIVIGPQGTGKTSMPNVIFRGNASILYGDHDDKDLKLLLHSGLCSVFDELDSFNKRDSSHLKALITTNEDNYRPPYAANNSIFPRRFVLYGCGNRYEFLQNDPSGYRRYAVLEVNTLLDFNGLEEVVPQLWAEAWDRYCMGGVRYWEVEGASENAKRHVIASPMEDAIRGIVESWTMGRDGTKLHKGTVMFTLTDIRLALGLDMLGANSAQTRDIQECLRGLYGTAELSRGPGGKTAKYYSVKIS